MQEESKAIDKSTSTSYVCRNQREQKADQETQQR